MSRSPRTAGAVAAVATALAVALALPASAQTDPTTTTTSTTTPAVPEKTVRVLDNIFKPRKVKVVVGTKVIWKWGGVAAHNVVVTKGPQKFKSKTQSKGTYARTISRPGKYLIVCTIHPGMTMTLRAKAAPPVTTTTTGVPETAPAG